MLVDLDREFACPAALVSEWLPSPTQHMRFRVVVREVEAMATRGRRAVLEILRRRTEHNPARA